MKKYIIVPIEDLNYALINKSTSRLLTDPRLSIDGTQAVLELLDNINTTSIPYRLYSDQEIRIELSKSEWSENQELIQEDSVLKSFIKKIMA